MGDWRRESHALLQGFAAQGLVFAAVEADDNSILVEPRLTDVGRAREREREKEPFPRKRESSPLNRLPCRRLNWQHGQGRPYVSSSEHPSFFAPGAFIPSDSFPFVQRPYQETRKS